MQILQHESRVIVIDKFSTYNVISIKSSKKILKIDRNTKSINWVLS